MAGNNQHDIPQALLRGFRVPVGSKKQSKTWLYEKGVAPHLELIKDKIAVERYFYSEPSPDGSRTLDDEITDYETRFDGHLRALKAAPLYTPVSADSAAEVVAHLTIRNAHLRRAFTSGLQKLLDRAVEVFCNESSLRSIIGVDETTPSDRLKSAIDEHLNENPALPASGLPAHVFHQMAHMMLKERFRAFFAENAPFVTQLFGTFTAQAPATVREGHNKVLSTTLAPDARIDTLKIFHWRVLAAPPSELVLPDCVALAEDHQPGLKPLIMADLAHMTTVLMPLSSQKMLVGTRDASAAPNLDGFNEAAIAASHSFFIAARLDQKWTNLTDRIGESAGQLIDSTVGSTFDEFLATRPATPVTKNTIPEADDLLSGSAAADPALEPTPVPAPRYTIHFHGCADEPIANEIAAVVYAVSESLAQAMPLDRIDGVTFASDYPAALRDLDRGFLASAPLQPTIEEYGISVAMAPVVMRDGICKTRLVLRGEIGHSLINEDEAIWRPALQVIAGQLAHASAHQMLDECLPGTLLRPIADRYDGFLYECVGSAWTGYLAARASAVFSPEGVTAQRELLLSVLKRAQDDIPAARLAYRFHGDMGKLLAIVCPRIADILRFSGSVLGHYAGAEQSASDHPPLTSALEKRGLRDWFVLFGDDLSVVWDRRGQWNSFHEILSLNRHVERLFWLYGLFPWKNENGQIAIVVPLASDADKLVGVLPLLRRLGVLAVQSLKRS